MKRFHSRIQHRHISTTACPATWRSCSSGPVAAAALVPGRQRAQRVQAGLDGRREALLLQHVPLVQHRQHVPVALQQALGVDLPLLHVLGAAGFNPLQQRRQLARLLLPKLGFPRRSEGQALVVQLLALAALQLVGEGFHARGVRVLALPAGRWEVEMNGGWTEQHHH